jgi:regulator of RNase E activity RraA
MYASFHILSTSLITNHPNIRRSIMRATDSFVKHNINKCHPSLHPRQYTNSVVGTIHTDRQYTNYVVGTIHTVRQYTNCVDGTIHTVRQYTNCVVGTIHTVRQYTNCVVGTVHMSLFTNTYNSPGSVIIKLYTLLLVFILMDQKQDASLPSDSAFR